MGLAYPNLHKMVLTKIDKDFECDVKFPEVDWNEFIEEENIETIKEKGIGWQAISYIYKPQIDKKKSFSNFSLC